MGTQAAKRLAALTKTLGTLDKVVVETAATTVTDALLHSVAGDVGSDRRMSGFGRRAQALDVQVRPLNGAGVRLTPARGQAGMWAILDGGAQPHDVVSKGAPIRGKGAKRARRQRDLDVAFGARGAFRGVKPLHWGQRGFAYRVHNVRSPAKRTWRTGAAKGVDDAVTAVRDEFHKAVTGGR